MDLDFFLEGFEEAWARGENPSVEAFLPPADHPAHERVLSELIRIDLEHRIENHEAISLADYARRFPGPFSRVEFVTPIARDEFRLRRQRGDLVSPEEYASRWGCDTSDWRIAGEIASRNQHSQLTDCTHSSSAAGSEETRQSSSPPNSTDSWEALLFPHTGVDLNRPTPPDASAHPASFRKFLGFEILERLGQGASAKVYLARQPALAGRLVVLKVTREPTVEADRLARLKHPNIVPIYSHHRTGPLQVLCMPFLGRLTLLDWVRRLRDWNSLPETSRELVQLLRRQRYRDFGTTQVATQPRNLESPLESATPSYEARCEEAETGLLRWEGRPYEQTVLWLIRQIARGLAHAHDRQVLHLDIKPGNVLLADDGEPLLLDFHLAQAPAGGEPSQVVGGTLPYMSPEQLTAYLDEAEVDHRSDLYSLGVMLWQLLCGQLPFRTQRPISQAQLPALLRSRQLRPLPPLGATSLTPAALAIVRHCTAFRPEDRYQSAYQLGVDLKRAIERQPLHYAERESAETSSPPTGGGDGI